MEASLVKILEQYRENEDPDLRQVDGKCLSTFSKEELMGELTKRNIDGVLLCRIGGINPLPEYLCRLVHYAMDRDTEDPIPGPSTKEDGPSVAKKKKKTSDAVTMVGLAEKIEKLEKELKEKKSSDEVSEFERAKRDVREEAQKAEVNIDVLHEKLVTLENVARRTNNSSKEKMTMILSRFHAHKATPSFVAHLVLKLVSNKDEESILEKEQKLMKHFGLDLKTKKGTSQTSKEGGNEQQSSSNLYPGGWGLGSFPPGGFGPMHFNAQPAANAMPFSWPSFLPAMRPPAPNRSRSRYNNAVKECFRCKKTTHLIKDCPLN